MPATTKLVQGSTVLNQADDIKAIGEYLEAALRDNDGNLQLRTLVEDFRRWDQELSWFARTFERASLDKARDFRTKAHTLLNIPEAHGFDTEGAAPPRGIPVYAFVLGGAGLSLLLTLAVRR